MRLVEKGKARSEILPGRIITKAVGKGSPSESGRMTVGFADYCAEAGPMEPHRHAEESVFIIRSDQGYLRIGDPQGVLGPRIPLRAGQLFHFEPMEWHVFEYDEGGRVEILFIYGQVDNIRPEEIRREPVRGSEMENGYFHRVQAQTPTRFWINNVTREETRLAIEAGAVGCTQNPSFPYKMLSCSDEAEKAYVYGLLDAILARQADDNEAQIELQRALVENIARAFLPIHETSGGARGFVSIQGDPFHEDTETIVRYARFNCTAPNIMAKVPATPDGLAAIQILSAEGIPINATEVMSVRQALDVCDAYEKGTRGMARKPVIYYSHIAGIFDEHLQNFVRDHHVDISPDVLWQAGVTAAKKTYEMVNARGLPIGFISGGARGLHHFTEMVGAAAVVTINWKGTAEDLIRQNPPVVQRFLQPAPHAVIDELCEKLPDFVKGYFVHAIRPEEYEHFGPVVLFRTMFEGAWQKASLLIAERRTSLGL